MWFTSRSKRELPTPESALPGRSTRLQVAARHFVLDTPIEPPYPAGLQEVVLGLGCFWGAERMFWKLDGVYTTEAGYAGGLTPNPTYEEVCSGRTGHTEVVRVVFDPSTLTLGAILRVFWEGHDPTQGMRQGNDVGTQYRSAIYTSSPQALETALATRDAYATALAQARRGEITTEIAPAGEFYPAEDYHQQYLAKVPNGYCGIGGTGVSCPVGVAADVGVEGGVS